MDKIITRSEDIDDLSIRFDRDRKRGRQYLSNSKSIKGKHHVRIVLKDIFGFAEHQQKATYGLGYKLPLIKNNDHSVLNKYNAINIGKIKINGFELYVTNITPSIPQQSTLSEQILSKVPTELQYVERSVLMKEVNTQNL